MSLIQALKRFDSTNLRLRIISASIMAPGALLAVYFGGLIYSAAVAGVVTIGFYEWSHIVAPSSKPQTVGIACSSLVISLIATVLLSPLWGLALLGASFLVALLIALRQRTPRPAAFAFGVLYMGLSGIALLEVRADAQNGAAFVFYLLAVVWSTDIGAFLTGSLLGGPKLAPKISPKKTWTGFFGGLIAAVTIGTLVARALGAELPEAAFVFSLILSGMTQGGDLFESYVKRRAGVKESGDLIPGHGGILDRIDGLVFAAIFAFLFKVSFGGVVPWW
ncbi:MAG: phosphatidate cytidylyltransferase [Alphaproteobacteria bacterium]|nr:phosphatidate cytidylyltransferase [Alphaproteobacteria bacterium]